jgi:cell division protein FtsI/penicillin-binding protein 2
LLLPSSIRSAAQPATQAALVSSLQGTSAVGLVIDVATGHTQAIVHPSQAQSLRSAPGSILKPFFLAAALEQRKILPQTAVFCRRNLRIQDGPRAWNLACTHPPIAVAFSAAQALAYSCNQYFAELADRLLPSQSVAILEHFGLPAPPVPETREQNELLVLGVAGIAVSPAQVAAAYRKLALETALPAVLEGLRDSVSYGMAHNAAVPGIEILGKTGTAGDTANGPSHGWFAGISDLGHQKIVIVIYLPHGNGADAARLAQHFFLTAKAARP